jgi:UDP-N-acetyl-D-mannosaminuronic acid transferase (WecB/TagA/CpsF family)
VYDEPSNKEETDMIYRLRIKEPDGSIQVIDMTHSQVSSYLTISREEFRKFIRGAETVLPDGASVYMINHFGKEEKH